MRTRHNDDHDGEYDWDPFWFVMFFLLTTFCYLVGVWLSLPLRLELDELLAAAVTALSFFEFGPGVGELSYRTFVAFLRSCPAFPFLHAFFRGFFLISCPALPFLHAFFRCFF